jgi:hypothetical protein
LARSDSRRPDAGRLIPSPLPGHWFPEPLSSFGGPSPAFKGFPFCG